MTVVKKHKQGKPDGGKLIDRVINQYGYGWVVWKNFILSFLVLTLEGFHMTFFGNMIIPLKSFFHLKEKEIQIISSFFFIFCGMGSFFAGYLTERFQRVTIMNISLLTIAVCHFAMAFTRSSLAFTALSLVIGTNMGIVVPISFNLITEYLPIKNRSSVLTSVWLGYGFGQLYILIIMLLIMPNYETKELQLTLMLSSTLSIFTFLITFFWLKDSPRNLIQYGKNEEAFHILDSINGVKLSDYEKDLIISQTKGSVKEHEDVSISEMFSKELRMTSILLTFIWVLYAVVFYGPYLISSLTMHHLNQESITGTNRDIILKQITIGLLSLPSNALGGYISEIRFFGRNKTTNIFMLFSMVFNILIVANSANYEIYLGLYMALNAISMNVNNTYSCEIYPTRIRDIAIGFLFFVSKVGGGLSQFLYIYLHTIEIFLPYHVTTLLCSISVVLVYCLPIETYNRPLDVEIHPLDEEESEMLFI
jgi:AAHS family benzoate transporter-like MFS transporter